MTREEFLSSAGALAAVLPQPSASAPPPLPQGFTLAAFDAALATTAKHRHLFACISDARDAMMAVSHTSDAYREIGVAASDVHAAVVFYHGTAVLSAFDDGIWTRYVVPSKTLGKRPAGVRELTAPTFVCNLATHGFASHFAQQLKLDEKAVYADMVSHLTPPAMLVPAGVWAVHAVEERGYTVLQFS